MSDNQIGTQHPLSLLAHEAYTLFSELGFEITSGPECETEWYNFDALNVPKDHPARDMQDTFYVKSSSLPDHDKKDFPDDFKTKRTSSELSLERSSDLLVGDSDGRGQTISKDNSDSVSDRSNNRVLRTHNTNTTARVLERVAKENLKEFASISIGKVFRNEATDATHEMQFFQIDGCMLGENISLASMKAVLIEFYKKVLGENVEIEFRPSFFPFTEPSVEVHAKWNGKWLEMMGGGMIHPNVLRNAGLDPEKVQGFAFGGGLDRIAMIKWGIPDVRLFYQGDVRLNQF